MEEAGKDFVGVCLDSGNPLWTIEDPHLTLETLHPYVLTSHVRDTAVWAVPEGAAVQWVRMGDGNIGHRFLRPQVRRIVPRSRPVARNDRHAAAHLPLPEAGVLGSLPPNSRLGIRTICGAGHGRKPRPEQPAPTKENAAQLQREDLEASMIYTRKLIAFMSQLSGKVAIVTGGSRGIGRAIAETFVREGATTVICGRKQDRLDPVAEEVNAQRRPGKVVPRACHVGKLDESAALGGSVTGEFGKIDVLVNNAATNIAQGPAIEMDDSQFDKMVEVNLKSTYRLVRLVAPGMCDRGSGSIINIASIAGLRPQYPWPAVQHDEGGINYDDSVLCAGTWDRKVCA